MRANEVLVHLSESRGVSARQPGDVYVSVGNPEKTITIVEIKFVRPAGDYSFDTRAELDGALDQVIPANGKRINDNAPAANSRAAIVAEVETSGGDREYWVRYMQDLMSVHGKWLTFRGYKYQASIETESLPIKPSDIIPDETPRSLSELLSTIDDNLHSGLAGTPYEHFADLIDRVIEEAAGHNKPIQFDKRSQAGIIAKYAGEYAGVIALLSDNIQNFKLADIEKRFGIQNMAKSKVVFPQNTTGMLVDSYLITPDGHRISVSSKMHKSGGAASSLLGIYKLMNDNIAQQYPRGANIVKDLAVMPAFSADPRNAGTLGPVILAQRLNIISASDIEEIESLDRKEQNKDSLRSPRLRQIVSNQSVAVDTAHRHEYSVYYHLIAAIVNILVARINADPEFAEVINATLRENTYIQILTKIGLQGNNVTFQYFVKLPDSNRPFVYNKNYFATGNKGRIGFKLEK